MDSSHESNASGTEAVSRFPIIVLRSQLTWESRLQEIQSLLSQLAVETRIRYGAQRFLQALSADDTFVPEDERDALRRKVTDELDACERKMASLERRVRELRGESRESSEVDSKAPGNGRGGVGGSHGRQGSISHNASSSTLASNFTPPSPSHASSTYSSSHPIPPQDASRRRALSNATVASNASHDRSERVVYTEPDQMSIISSSESGQPVSRQVNPISLMTSPRSQMRQSRQAQVDPFHSRNPSTSRSRSRHGSIRTGGRPSVPQQQYSLSTSVAHSLESIDALSRLANAVPSNGIVRRHSLSLDTAHPFDVHSPVASSSSPQVQATSDPTHTHAEKEERRKKEYEEALTLARDVILGLETLQRTPLAPAYPPIYGLAKRRTTEHADQGDELTPSAARRYASFMRNEGLPSASSIKTSRKEGMSGSSAKLIALLTRCIKECPAILAELDFSHLVDV